MADTPEGRRRRRFAGEPADRDPGSRGTREETPMPSDDDEKARRDTAVDRAKDALEILKASR
jgi:hypothetical protein